LTNALKEEEIERWTARRQSQLVLEIIHGKTSVSEAARQFDLPSPEIERWIDDGKCGLESALRAKYEDVREQWEHELEEPSEAYGEAMPELRARKLWRPCWARTRPDGLDPAGTPGGRHPDLDGEVVPMVRQPRGWGTTGRQKCQRRCAPT
jgi:hypothetical protein